jgi:hypothetical protein
MGRDDLSGVKVGDELILTESANHRSEPRRVPVVKVGRKLLTVQVRPGQYGTEVFRIDTGRLNDRYGYSHVYTLEHYAYTTTRADLLKALQGHGLRFDLGRTPEDLAILANLLRAIEGNA